MYTIEAWNPTNSIEYSIHTTDTRSSNEFCSGPHIKAFKLQWAPQLLSTAVNRSSIDGCILSSVQSTVFTGAYETCKYMSRNAIS